MIGNLPELKLISSTVWWLWLPIIALGTFTVIELFAPSKFYAVFVGENGPLEYLQVFIILAAIILAFRGIRHSKQAQNKMYIFACALAAAGSIYIFGEEISWGQHVFKWATPQEWSLVNDQQETNLHNTSSWLDQKPRLVLEIGVIVGGLILPGVLRYRENMIPSWLAEVTPPGRMAVIALCFITIKFFDKLGDATEFVFYKRASEMTEMYIYYFVALYLYYLIYSLKHQAEKL